MHGENKILHVANIIMGDQSQMEVYVYYSCRLSQTLLYTDMHASYINQLGWLVCVTSAVVNSTTINTTYLIAML